MHSSNARQACKACLQVCKYHARALITKQSNLHQGAAAQQWLCINPAMKTDPVMRSTMVTRMYYLQHHKAKIVRQMSARGPPGARGCTRMPQDDESEGGGGPPQSISCMIAFMAHSYASGSATHAWCTPIFTVYRHTHPTIRLCMQSVSKVPAVVHAGVFYSRLQQGW